MKPPRYVIMRYMQECIALLAPTLIALGFYNHLNRDKLSAKKLLFSFGVFALLVNLCTYLVLIFLLGKDGVYFEHKPLISYFIVSGIFAFILPFVVNLVEHAIAIEVKHNDEK